MCVRLLPCPGPAGCWHRCGGQGGIRTLQPSLPGPDLPCYCSSSETQAAHPPPPRHQQNKRPRPWPDTRALSARSLRSRPRTLPWIPRALSLGERWVLVRNVVLAVPSASPRASPLTGVGSALPRFPQSPVGAGASSPPASCSGQRVTLHC